LPVRALARQVAGDALDRQWASAPAMTDDDYLVSLAIEQEADMVVSGDAGVLAGTGDAVPRLTPAEALARLPRAR
jgi:predicted nucleic acid-binding protein